MGRQCRPRRDHALIGRVIGVGHQHLVTLVDRRHHRGEEGRLGAGKKDELLIADGRPVDAVIERAIARRIPARRGLRYSGCGRRASG